MENEILETRTYKLGFVGKGSTFFGIWIKNWLLTIITLGFYYPWAKVKQLNFMYSSTTLNGDKFSFSGTGKEIFKGYIKTLLFFVLVYGLLFLFLQLDLLIIGFVIMYFGNILIIPLIIHGSYRYRMSRTFWRDIRFGYRGDRNELFINYLKWSFFTIITLGFYGAWMEIKINSYILNNLRLGDTKFKFSGKGWDYFLLNLKGLLLSIITLGIYLFWYVKNIYNYYIDNITLQKDFKKITFKSTATFFDMFNLIFVNYIILVFTLGFGYAWVATRSMNIVVRNIQMEGDIDLNTIQQTEDDYNDATGDDMVDFLNIDMIF
jgi:uncharacterized membrane protein YjgN (DUF898 family)